jgi:SAM-dependent methyltransferase
LNRGYRQDRLDSVGASDAAKSIAARAMSFGAISDQYAQFRPPPPPEVLDILLPAEAGAVVDVGAGTGNLTLLLVKRVRHVTAVEPDPRMRRVLAERVPQAAVLEARAEQMPLPDGSQDAVLASSAWHWVDTRRAVPEAARVLRAGGRLGVIWTSPDREQEWVVRLWSMMRPDGPALGRERKRRKLRLPAGAPFAPERGPLAVRFTRRFTRSQLRGLAGTYSGVITLGAEQRQDFLARLDERLGAEHRFADPAGIEVPMVAYCWYADRL